jgi:peptidyl-prolyl cis-trans isomerase C
MNHARTLLVAAMLPTLAACAPKASNTVPSLGTGPAVATVNGTPIGQDFFSYYVKRVTGGKSPADLTPEQRGNALDQLIRAEVLAQQATTTKDGKESLDSDTTQLLALTQLEVLQNVATEKKVPKPTEQELRAAYEDALTNEPKVEYHAKHILLATEAFAQKVVERLDKGEKFEEIAKRESMDTSSKDSGGDIGWFSPSNMEPTFVSAVTSLKNGTYTHAPVQTRYGWHVIELVETRDAPPPPSFDNVKPRLEQFLGQKKIRAYQDELMRTAKIEKKLDQSSASGSAKPAAATKGSASSTASSASK